MSSVNNAHYTEHYNELYWNRKVDLDFWICVCNGWWWWGGWGGGVVADFRQYCETMLMKCKFCMCSVSL